MFLQFPAQTFQFCLGHIHFNEVILKLFLLSFCLTRKLKMGLKNAYLCHFPIFPGRPSSSLLPIHSLLTSMWFTFPFLDLTTIQPLSLWLYFLILLSTNSNLWFTTTLIFRRLKEAKFYEFRNNTRNKIKLQVAKIISH